MKRIAILVLVSIAVIGADIYCSDSYEERIKTTIERYKQDHDFVSWPGKTKPAIPRIKKLSKNEFTSLDDAKEVSSDTSDITKTDDMCFKVHRYYWKTTEKDRIFIRIVQAESSTDAHEYLIRRWTHVSSPYHMKPKGSTYDVNLGDVCFVSPAREKDAFARIWFIRNNIVVEIIGEGKMKKATKEIATKIDSLLLLQCKENNYDPHLGRVNEIKQLHKFSQWAGSVKICAKKFLELPIREADFSRYGEIKVFSPEKERDRCLSIQLLGNKETNGAHITMGLYESPLAAHQAIMRALALTTHVPPNYQKAKKRDRMDIGDVCFFPMRAKPPTGAHKVVGKPFFGRLYFARNNIGVTIINNTEEGKEHLDIVKLAKYIDRKLIQSLK